MTGWDDGLVLVEGNDVVVLMTVRVFGKERKIFRGNGRGALGRRTGVADCDLNFWGGRVFGFGIGEGIALVC